MSAAGTFEAMNRLSDHMHRLHKQRELNAAIRYVGTRCGDCQHWMKSSQCPRERNVNGYTRGPSAGDIRCNSFVEDCTATKHRSHLQEQLSGTMLKGR